MKTQEIMDKILPGDVVSIDGAFSWGMAVPYWAIRSHQRAIFRSPLRPEANWRETHSTLYLGPEHLFSVEPPVAMYFNAEGYISKRLREGSKVSVWRRGNFSAPLLGGGWPEYLGWMREGADRIFGTKYDYVQLVGIAVMGLLGYGTMRKPPNFLDLGTKRKVCSVAVRAVFEYARHKAEQVWGVANAPKRLFTLPTVPAGENKNMMVSPYWTDEEKILYGRPSVECTTPAHLTNSQYYNGEFTRVI
jgi:hypothetical protein